MENILENIRKIRESKGYSQEAIADQLKMTQSKYARFERGATKTDLETLCQVANIFGMSLVDLIAYPEKMVKATSLSGEESSELRAILQIELKKERKEQVLKLVFGENNLEILNR